MLRSLLKRWSEKWAEFKRGFEPFTPEEEAANQCLYKLEPCDEPDISCDGPYGQYAADMTSGDSQSGFNPEVDIHEQTGFFKNVTEPGMFFNNTPKDQ